jgi:hypothetical protein
MRARLQACKGFNLVAEYSWSLATMPLGLRQQGTSLFHLLFVFSLYEQKNEQQNASADS